MRHLIKLTELFHKLKNNKYYFLYHLFHYMKIKIPFRMANYIARHNFNPSDRYNFSVRTYDGSNQAVHPDFTYFRNQYWFAFTPYPYGMDEYENPCVYRCDRLDKIHNHISGPIDMPKTRKYGYHLSDPCIAEDNDSIKCYYRESVRYKTGIERHSLFYSKYNFKLNKWCAPVLIKNNNADKLLSPAVINAGTETFCYYAEWNDDDGGLFRARIADDRFTDNTRVNCHGLPEMFHIWHMSIVFKDSLCKCGLENMGLIGIFLIRSHNHPSVFKLYNAFSPGINKDWYLADEILLPDALRKEIKTVYKSCYIPGCNQILVGYRDNRDIYRLAVLNQQLMYAPASF